MQELHQSRFKKKSMIWVAAAQIYIIAFYGGLGVGDLLHSSNTNVGKTTEKIFSPTQVGYEISYAH